MLKRENLTLERLNELKEKYNSINGDYLVLTKEVVRQLKYLFKNKNIKLAVPMENRIKTWESIVEKIDRYDMQINNISEINDISGIRIIVLFKRDIDAVSRIIEETFEIHRKENIDDRLSENQFGYGSIHFEISLPNTWYDIPAFQKLKGLKTEIQLRTVSQHNWAAASHILQYKNEKDVPSQLKRSIYRVAALLETVDLEFERLLTEREEYIGNEEELNVETLKSILMDFYPKNALENEPYSEILELLYHFKIDNAKELRNSLYMTHPQFQREEDLNIENSLLSLQKGEPLSVPEERVKKGVYFSHMAIIRIMLEERFDTDEISLVLKQIMGKEY
ncbi:ppGpp synthetase catalytic domain-containing protein (RelA/SpoT-type nucleotidyltranferase) [Bacillus sp. OK838]|nr:ppGpp synthetase catalytic domain-containing protein (RelA/SpoT-type nucleotidyltranferase) [Bacillus sp. OK838]